MRFAMPLCWLPPVAYHLLVARGAHILYAAPVAATLPSGRSWAFDLGDCLLLGSLLLLAISSFRRGGGAVVSTPFLVAGVCLALLFLFEFMVLSAFGTSLFFMLVVSMVLELVIQAFGADRFQACTRGSARPGDLPLAGDRLKYGGASKHAQRHAGTRAGDRER